MAVTRNDVAKLAGVSPGVVSYVLNDGSRPVAPATRQRVLDAIKELGYRPDGLARSLRMGRTRTLGLVLPDASNPFFAELARAIENAAYSRGFAVMVCNSADDTTRERTYVQSLAERRIDGLILVSATNTQDLTDFTELAIPVVGLDRSPDESPISTIRSDNEQGAYLGARHLIEHGHERIAFVAGPDIGVTDARRQGWRRALTEARLSTAWAFSARFSFAGGYDAGDALFAGRSSTAKADASPTAVLVSSDIQALGLLSGLQALDLGVPRDVAVISFDGTTAGRYAVPPLTSIAQPIAAMGAQAVTQLVERPSQVTHLTLENHLIVRRSCGCGAG